VTTNRRLGLLAGTLLGIVGLTLFVVFSVVLPKLTEPDDAELPDSLPGGWKALDVATPPSGDAGRNQDLQEERFDYVRQIYADVYDEPVAFRSYTDRDFSTFVSVTLFASDGGAFGPPTGVADPEVLGLKRATTELVRKDDVVCIVSYQAVSVDEDDTEDSAAPLGAACQLPTDGQTIQLATNGLSLDDTVELVHKVEDSI
jgi:hypothetical protein